MKTSRPSGHRAILPPAPTREPVTTPFSEAVDAYRQERRKSLRMLGLLGLFCVSVAAAFLLTLGRMTATPRDAAPGLAQVSPPKANPSDLERLLAENLMLKEQLDQADHAIEELRSLIIRHSAENVAEESGAPAQPTTQSAPEAAPAALETLPSVPAAAQTTGLDQPDLAGAPALG